MIARKRFALYLTVCLAMALTAAGLACKSSRHTTATTDKDQNQAAADAPAASPEQPKEKIEVTRLDDLPRHNYPFTGQVAELVESREQIVTLARKVRADVESDLATYKIDDATTLKRMYGTLLTVDLIEGNDDAVLRRAEMVRDLEDKEPARLMTGLIVQSMIAAKRESGAGPESDRYKHAFREELSARLAPLPWNVIQDKVEQYKGMMEIYSQNLLMGAIQAQIQPAVDKTGELNADQAAGVLGMHVLLTQRLPIKDDIVAVYAELIAANRVEKPDIWAARSVTLSPDEDLHNVLIAVWDSGVDDKVFADVLWENPNDPINGADDDGNGYVDDFHGIAYDVNARRTTGSLFPLGEAVSRMPAVMQYMKGFMDVQASVDSDEASALKQHLGSLAPGQVKGFLEDLSLAGNYAHGTHVAGIMTSGNPFARVLIARHSYDFHTVPVARTVEWGRRDGAKCRDTINYLKNAGVRVVNMSWGEALDDAEDSLEANGIGDSAEERRDIARKVFALQKDGLYEGINGAPDILFVCAAGNADNDVEFDEDVPSSFDLPNLIVVGAVDQAGEPTGFTSFGRTVQVYANGFEVESYVPGGQRMKMSGTSMASPQVANLAAKLLAINPSLEPAELIDLIKKGADQRKAGDVEYLLLNPKHTVELARSAN